MFSIYDILRLPPAITVIDVGAMWLGEQAVSYRNLLTRAGTTVIGFEPVQAECDKLNAMMLPGHVFLPYVIGDGSDRTFYTTNHPMTSSMYEPNTALLRQFSGIEEVMRVVSATPCQTRRLDDIPEVRQCHFLKIDVQGGELDVLRGATRLLAETAVVQCEVEFLQIYKGQPLFADVDAFMRSQGFMLHRFASPSGRLMRPFAVRDTGAKAASPSTQVLWTDAIYMPDLTTLATQPPDRLLRTAIMLHEIFRHADMVSHLLLHHDRLTGSDFWAPYVKKLTGHIPARPSLE